MSKRETGLMVPGVIDTTKTIKPLGILGGTFDPIHFGHLRCALELYQDLNLDEVRLIPCKKPVHKDAATATPEQRKKMIELAIAGEPALVLDSRELDRKTPSYMVETLESIRQEVGPDKPLCLILGVDAFMGLADWHQWERIIDLAHIIMIDRPDYHMEWQSPLTELLKSRLVKKAEELKRQPAGLVLIHKAALLATSATQIRALLCKKESPRYLLPQSVLDYIDTKKLYSGLL